MSHHFDYPEDETLDISDAYCFAGARDARGPRTVFGMNASPTTGTPWDPAGYYELRLDTNEDYVEDITWRAAASRPRARAGRWAQGGGERRACRTGAHVRPDRFTGT